MNYNLIAPYAIKDFKITFSNLNQALVKTIAHMVVEDFVIICPKLDTKIRSTALLCLFFRHEWEFIGKGQYYNL